MTSNVDLAIKASSLGVDLTNEGHIEAGIAQHYRATRLDPGNWGFRALLAGSLVNEGRIEEALPHLEGCPDDQPFVATIKAYIHLENGDVEASLPLFKMAMDKDARGGAAEFDYAFHLLYAGHLAEGFKHYECRRVYRVERTFANTPMWDGKHVKRLLVWCEQGVGDCIQFVRYIPWLSARCDELIFGVPNNLLALFENYKKFCKIVPATEVVNVDAEVGLMSLPFFHGTTFDNIPPETGLLNIGTATGSLRNGNKLRVGIVWAGNPQQIRNKYRSIPFKTMIEVLGGHPNFELFSLQCGKWSEDINKHGAQTMVTDLSGLVAGDWSATGAVLRELDAFISPCTGPAHLAGALGVKTYMCVHTTPDWRWFMNREDSPWYPSFKIIRQKKRGDWHDVLARVADDLEKTFAEQNPAQKAA